MMIATEKMDVQKSQKNAPYAGDTAAQDTKKDPEWLTIVDPTREVIVLGIPFRAEEGEAQEPFTARWKAYLGVVHHILDPGLPKNYDTLSPQDQQHAQGARDRALAYGLTMLQLENLLYGEPMVPNKDRKQGGIFYRDILSPPTVKEEKGPRFVRSTIRQGCDYIETEFDDGTVVRKNKGGVVIETIHPGKGDQEETQKPDTKPDTKPAPQEAIAARDSVEPEATDVPNASQELESRVTYLQEQVEELRKKIEDREQQRTSAPELDATVSSSPGSYASTELAGIYEQLEQLKRQASSGAVSPSTSADLERIVERLGQGLGNQFGQTLNQGLRSLVSEIMQGIRSVQRDALASGVAGRMVSGDYSRGPEAREAQEGAGATEQGSRRDASPSESGESSAPGDYAAMSYEQVGRAVRASLKSEKARMILQTAISNCGNERGEQALRKLIGKFPEQESALREFMKKHRQRIGV